MKRKELPFLLKKKKEKIIKRNRVILKRIRERKKETLPLVLLELLLISSSSKGKGLGMGLTTPSRRKGLVKKEH